MRHDDRPERALVDQLLALAVGLAVVALQPDDDRQLLLRRLLARLENLVHARDVNRERLLHKDVLLGGDSRLEVLGAEARRGDQQHRVHVRAHNLFVAVDADVGPLRVDVEFGAALSSWSWK